MPTDFVQKETMLRERGKKISIAKKGKKRPQFSEEWIKNMSKAQMGHKRNLGRKFKHTEETKRKIGIANAGKIHLKTRGEANVRWKGGYERKLWRNRKRIVIKSKNGGFHTLGNWQNLKAQYNWTCPSCKNQEPEIKLSADHIIPLSKGGSDNIENIQPLCRSCNSKKGIKILTFD